MLATASSSLKVSQSFKISCFLISDFDCNANCRSFALKFTVVLIIEIFSASDLN